VGYHQDHHGNTQEFYGFDPAIMTPQPNHDFTYFEFPVSKPPGLKKA